MEREQRYIDEHEHRSDPFFGRLPLHLSQWVRTPDAGRTAGEAGFVPHPTSRVRGLVTSHRTWVMLAAAITNTRSPGALRAAG
jgi:hypothetical protein